MWLTILAGAIPLGLIFGLNTLLLSMDRRRHAQPTLIDVLQAHIQGRYGPEMVWCDTKLTDRLVVEMIYRNHGPSGLENHLRLNFPGNWDTYSIDYLYPHRTTDDDKIIAGRWDAQYKGRGSHAKVYFYRLKAAPLPAKVEPPKPVAPPPPPTPSTWSERDEKNQRDLFAASPAAFWLSPDWDTARTLRQPFWMIEPKKITEAADDRIKYLAEAIRSQHKFHDVQYIGKSSFVIDGHTGERFTDDEVKLALRLSLSDRQAEALMDLGRDVKKRMKYERQYR